jgi:RHS repeat-associated protein
MRRDKPNRMRSNAPFILALAGLILLTPTTTGLAAPSPSPSSVPAQKSPHAPSVAAATLASITAGRAVAKNNKGRPEPVHSGTWHTASAASASTGFVATQSKELTALDTATTRTYTNPDGTVTSTSYTVPVNFRGADGTFHHVDPSVVARGDGSFHNAAGADDIRFGGIGDPHVLSESDGKHSVGFDLPAGAAAGAPSRTDNSIVYLGIKSGIDVHYTVAADGVKELIVLNAPPAGSGDFHMTFPLRLTGLTAVTGSDGGILFQDSSGVTVYEIAPGVMGDSNIDPGSGEAPSLPVSFGLSPNGSAITVTADGSWLRDPARKYPVTIDPSIINAGLQTSENDSYTSSAYPTSSYRRVWDSGQSDYTDPAGYYSDSTGTDYTWLTYDVSPVNGKHILSAIWSTYFEWTSSCSATTYWLHAATAAWTPGAVTWNNQPGVFGTATGSVAANWQGCGSETKAWSNADVTSFVANWASGTWVNNGMRLDENGNGSDYWKKIASDETAISGAWSHINITYEGYGSPNYGADNSNYDPPSGADHPTLRDPAPYANFNMPVFVVNEGSDTWPANGNYRLSYHVYDRNNNLISWDGARTMMPVDVPPGVGIWLGAQIAGLAAGQYFVKFDMVEEGQAWFSSYCACMSGPWYLLIEAPPPTTSPTGVITTTTPTLSTSGCPACTGYKFEISTSTATTPLVNPSNPYSQGGSFPNSVPDQTFANYVTSSGWTTSSWTVPSGILKPGRQYYWHVVGRDDKASTSFATPASFTTASVPSVPQTVSASPGASQATVNWTAPSNTGGSGVNLTGYSITYTDYANGHPVAHTVSAPSTATSATLSGLNPGQQYTFSVAAQNAMGLGQSAAAAPVVPVAVPGAPTGVVVIGGNASVSVAWSAPPSNGSPIASYTVTVTQGSAHTLVYPTSSPYVVPTLVNGTSASVTITATNGVGVGGPSTAVAATPNAGPTVTNTLSTSQVNRGARLQGTAVVSPTVTGTGETDAVTVTAPVGYVLSGSAVTIDGHACTNRATSCVSTPTSIALSGVQVQASGSSIVYSLIANGDDRQCDPFGISASVTNAAGQGAIVLSAPATVCDGGVGQQRWWTPWSSSLSVGGSVSVNPGNGNLAVSVADDTPFQLHGHLSLSPVRVYNSMAQSHPASEPAGIGWTFSWIRAGEKDSLVGLASPSSDESAVRAQAIEGVSASGAREIFTPQPLPADVNVTALGTSTGALAPLELDGQLSLDAGYTRVCVDATYASEPGIHVGMWRYVETTKSSCSGLTTSNASVLGYASLTPERVRQEYSADGRLLTARDASGNAITFTYDPANNNRLVAVGESSGALRQFTLSYGTWNGPDNLTDVQISVTDPAGRTTKYGLNASSHLVKVTNPSGGGALVYTYGPSKCVGDAAADDLCSATDAFGSATGHVDKFAYTTGVNGGPPRALTVTDRRSTTSTWTYAADSASASVDIAPSGQTSGERRRFAQIDNTGRVGEADEGETSNNWLHITLNQWDTPGCRYPDDGPDNNLCDILRLALNSGQTPDRHTTYVYDDLGHILVQCDASAVATVATSTTCGVNRLGGAPPDLVSTAGYTSQYVKPGGVTMYTDSLAAGNGAVSTSPAGSRTDSTTLFVVADQTALLPPNGNVSGLTAAQVATFATSDTFDANSSVGAGIPLGAGGGCGPTHANSGLLCTIAAASRDGSNATTTIYTYDANGQRATMTTPDEVVAGAGTPYQYTYYPDTGHDLSNTTPAGGWLQAVTDPAGRFVAYGYDAAGNVARTWDRTATAASGLTAASFPGSLASPPAYGAGPTVVPYAQNLRGVASGSAPYTSAYQAPWRYQLSTRDALGNVTTTQVDVDGNVIGVRGARGTGGAPTSTPACSTPGTGQGTYDTCSTYSAADDRTATYQPVEAQLSGSPHTSYAYDPYGNETVTQDPRGYYTITTFDSVNRSVAVETMRSTLNTAALILGNCWQSNSNGHSDTPIAGTTTVVCGTSTSYDGVDNETASTDANGNTTTSFFDAFHRKVGQLAPLFDLVHEYGETTWGYDADGHLTRTCPPRAFAEGDGCQTDDFAVTAAYNAAGDQIASTALCASSCSQSTLTTVTTYDNDGNKTTVTDANGNKITYTYGSAAGQDAPLYLDRLSQMTPPSGSQTSATTYGHDPSGNQIWTSQATSTGTRDDLVTYDADNRPLDTITAAVDSSFTATTDPNAVGLPDDSTAHDDNVRTRSVYDADGHVVAVYAARAFATGSLSSPTTQFMTRTDYDADGRPTAQYVPRYDTSVGSVIGDLSTLTGNASYTTYDQTVDCPIGATGYASSVGVCVTAAKYDADSRKSAILLPTAGNTWSSNRQETITYTDDGLVNTVSGPNPASDGSQEVLQTNYYDGAGNVVASQGPAFVSSTSDVTLTTYSATKNPVSTVLCTTTVAYAGGQCNTGTLVATNHSSNTRYDARGDVVSQADSNSATTTTSYLTTGWLGSTSDPDGNTTSYSYDSVGNKAVSTSPSASAHDATNPLGCATTMSYYPDNLLHTTTTPTSSGSCATTRVVTDQYDGAGQRTSEQTSGGIGGYAYTYFLDGRQAAAAGRDGDTRSFQYDANGDTTSATDTAYHEAWHAPTTQAALTYSYYADGSLRQSVDGDASYGFTTDYGYNGAGDVTTLDQSNTAGANNEWIQYGDAGLQTQLMSVNTNSGAPESRSYDAAGNLTLTTQANGVKTQDVYAADDTLSAVNLTQGNGTSLMSYSYARDANGRVTGAWDSAGTVSGSGINAGMLYAYTPAGRLSQFTIYPAAWTSVSYDHDGNRTGYTGLNQPASTSTYHPDDTLATTTSSTTLTDSYDAAGRVVGDGCFTYVYNGFDQVTSATPTAGRPALCTGASESYAYDALGRQGEVSSAAASYWTHYDGTIAAPIFQEQLGASHLTVYEPDASGAATAVTLAWVATQYLAPDGQGNVGYLTNNFQNPQCSLYYDLYGAGLWTQSATNPCQIGSEYSTLGYHLASRAPQTGQYSFGARQYDPAKAAFLTPDAYHPGSTTNDVWVGTDPLTEDRYAYVNGDPINLVDPNGHAACAGGSQGSCMAPGRNAKYTATQMSAAARAARAEPAPPPCDLRCQRTPVASVEHPASRPSANRPPSTQCDWWDLVCHFFNATSLPVYSSDVDPNTPTGDDTARLQQQANSEHLGWALPFLGLGSFNDLPDPSQLKRLSPKQIRQLQGDQVDPEELKEDIVGKGLSGKSDLFYNPDDGRIFVLPKSGEGEPNETGLRFGSSGVESYSADPFQEANPNPLEDPEMEP